MSTSDWAIGIRQKIVPLTSFSFLRGGSNSSTGDSVGKDAWQDRVEAEKNLGGWLAEYPSTFITVTGPSGSGKVSLVNRVLLQEKKYVVHPTPVFRADDRPALVIDCAEIGKSKNDAALVGSLAEQTGEFGRP